MERENCTDRTAANCREDGDDEKMETFFALMKNFRNKLHQLQEINAGNKRIKTSAAAGGWAPAFRIEDFTAEIEFKRHVPVLSKNLSNDIGKEERNDPIGPNLQSPPDLKLTL